MTKLPGVCDEIKIRFVSAEPDRDGRQVWRVTVVVPGRKPRTVKLEDPWSKNEYESHLKPREANIDSSKKMFREDLSKYAKTLIHRLRLDEINLLPNIDHRICIIDAFRKKDPASRGVHSLLWETLEDINVWAPGTKCVQISRVLDSDNSNVDTMRKKDEYRILLVISRTFRQGRALDFIDYHASIILNPLLRIALYVGDNNIHPHLSIEVIRPGTYKELQRHIHSRGTGWFNLIHFDLHGKINKRYEPYLRFGMPYDPLLYKKKISNQDHANLYSAINDNSFQDVKIEEVAKLLGEYKIFKVALSACTSSYAQRGMISNMSEILIDHGISFVSAMCTVVLDTTVQAYYEAFYKALFLGCGSFRNAAAVGRSALRDKYPEHAFLPTDYYSNQGMLDDNIKDLRYISDTKKGLKLLCFGFYWLCAVLGKLFSISMTWVTNPLEVPHMAPEAEGLKRYQLLDVDIEHLIIEDQLTDKGSQGVIYLHCGKDEKRKKCVEGLAETWLLTGFVDSVYTIPAPRFSNPIFRFLPLSLHKYKSRFRCCGGKKSYRERARILIVEDSQALLPKNLSEEQASPQLRKSLKCMTGLIKRFAGGSEKSYVIITGQYLPDWWEGVDWNDPEIRDTWGKAVPYSLDQFRSRKA